MVVKLADPLETVPELTFWFDPPDMLTSNDPFPPLLHGNSVIVPSVNSRGPPVGSVMVTVCPTVTGVQLSGDESLITTLYCPGAKLLSRCVLFPLLSGVDGVPPLSE